MQVTGFKDTIDWYDQNAEQYAGAIGRVDLDQLTEFAKLLPPAGRVLDAGCAAGRDSGQLLNLGFKVTGVDLSKGLLEIARRDHPSISFIHASFLKLPLPDGDFDGVWAHASLLHLETVDEVSQALAEFYRILKPNGVVFIVVKAQLGADKTAIVSDKLSGHNRFFQYFTKAEMARLIQSAGFNVSGVDQFKETDKDPSGRPEVEWIKVVGHKVSSA